MNESISNNPEAAGLIHDQELAYLGALLTEAAMRSDLASVAEEHALLTGQANPNSYATNSFRVGEQAVSESSDSVYRMVDGRGAQDLADSGIVRGAKTAGAPQAKTSGHTTYWTAGETGKGSSLGQGFVIEAPLEAVKSGWVTANQVQGVYARDSDGVVKNLIANN